MPTKQFEVLVRAELGAVWDFHSSAKALQVLTPPNREIRWISSDLQVKEGAVHEFRAKVGPVWMRWKVTLTEVDPPKGFRDTAIRSPFKNWTHRHDFIPHPEGTLVRDTIDYEPPLGFLGAIANWLFISRDLNRLFAFRHAATRRALETASTSKLK